MERGAILRLTIEVEHLEPLSGWVGDPGHEMVPFTGWLGLGAHLDRLLAATGEPPPPNRPSE